MLGIAGVFTLGWSIGYWTQASGPVLEHHPMFKGSKPASSCSGKRWQKKLLELASKIFTTILLFMEKLQNIFWSKKLFL
jgi:hypothetical protein